MPVFPLSMSDFKPGETNIRSCYDFYFPMAALGVYSSGVDLCDLKMFCFFRPHPDDNSEYELLRFFKWKQAKHPVGCEEMKTPANSNNF